MIKGKRGRYWKEHLEAWRASGLSQAEYARQFSDYTRTYCPKMTTTSQGTLCTPINHAMTPYTPCGHCMDTVLAPD